MAQPTRQNREVQRLFVQCRRCSDRFVMRCPAGVGGLLRITCPHCSEVMVLVVHDEVHEAAA